MKTSELNVLQIEKCNEITPLLAEVGFKYITTAKDLDGKEPAQEGESFAFWCRKKG